MPARACQSVLLILATICVCRNAVCVDNMIFAQSETKPALPRQTIDASQMKRAVDAAIQQQQIVADLQPRVVGQSIVFDVSFRPNPANSPWMILLNLPEEKYRQSCREYESTGYHRTVDRRISVNRQTLYSVVWTRMDETEAATPLTLPAGALPESGMTSDVVAPLDDLMRSFLPANNIPGATLAVAYQNRLIYSRGFGYADIAQKTPMTADGIMRIASISKPVTAVAVLKLVEQGKLTLDDHVYELMQSQKYPLLKPADDQRWKDVTVRHLLQHSGGWDRDVSPDPMFQLVTISQKQKLRRPARQADIIRYQLHQPLNFQPGQRYAYSNFGYCILGRVIEGISGKTYPQFVSDEIFVPAGMTASTLGKTRESDRQTGEVRYHTQDQKSFPAVWESAVSSRRKTLPQLVPEPYGRWDIEVMDSHGGWISSAPDLVRFSISLHHAARPLLNEETMNTMIQPPEFATETTKPYWYGCGWNVRPVRNGANTWHTGSLAGTSTLLVHRWDGWSWAVLFNIDRTRDNKRCTDLIDPLIHSAVNRIPMIPQYDLFADPN